MKNKIEILLYIKNDLFKFNFFNEMISHTNWKIFQRYYHVLVIFLIKIINFKQFWDIKNCEIIIKNNENKYEY